jgi:N-acetylmuramoyl-L-alanine amidase
MDNTNEEEGLHMRKLQIVLNILIPVLVALIVFVNLLNFFPDIFNRTKPPATEPNTSLKAELNGGGNDDDGSTSEFDRVSSTILLTTTTKDSSINSTAGDVTGIDGSSGFDDKNGDYDGDGDGDEITEPNPGDGSAAAARTSSATPTVTGSTAQSAESTATASVAVITTADKSATTTSANITTQATSAANGATEPSASSAETAASTSQSSSGSGALKGKTICIDSGHQQKQNSEQEPVSPGSSTKKAKVASGTKGTSTGIPEYKITLEVGFKLKALLEKEGATVVMTREANDVNVSNVERAEIGNTANADIAVRLHADGNNNKSVNGISMLIPKDTTEYLSKSVVEKSQAAGKIVLDSVIKSTGAKNRGLSKRGDMTGFNWSKVPVILIEMGFMTNPEEDALLCSGAYQDKLAAGLCKGLIDYFS